MVELAFRPMRKTDEDLSMLYDLFAQHEGWRRTISSLKWQYFQNPIGKLYAHFAVDKGGATEELGAFYAACPHRFKTGAKTTTAVLSLDTITGAKYRRMGLFTKLAEEVYRRCEKDETSLVFGFPNANSAPGFFKRLGWSSLGPLPLFFKPLRFSVLVRTLLIQVQQLPWWLKFCFTSYQSAFQRDFVTKIARLFLSVRVPFSTYQSTTHVNKIKPLREFSDPRINELWDEFSKDISFAVVRDARYLAWRLVERPPRAYESLKRMYTCAAFYEHDRMKGFVAYRLKTVKGNCYGYIMELIYEPEAQYVGHALLGYAINDMYAQGAEMILAYNYQHSPNHSPFRTNHFFHLPEKYSPFELYFGTRVLALPEVYHTQFSRDWYISFCDFDTI